ncbi:MAG: hypothetical protein KAJ90_05785 [Desulfobacterales bacterium]|nr:hypothetical protein [Desulfobacterales bacterium]
MQKREQVGNEKNCLDNSVPVGPDHGLRNKTICGADQRSIFGSAERCCHEIHVLACALGVTRTRRDFVPFYYSELVEGVADLHITAFRVRGDARVHIRSQEVSSRSYRRKTYIFYMIGPINKEWKE